MGVTERFNNLDISSKDFRFCVEVPIKMQKNNYLYSSVPSYEKKRIAGIKKVNNFKDGFLILFEIIKLFFLKN